MEQVQVLWVSRSISPSGFGVKRHDHPYYHMFYVTAGTLDMTVGKQSFCIEAGHGLIVPKDTQHGYYIRGDQEAEYMEVKFILNNFPALDSQLSQQGTELFEDPTAGALIRQLVQEYAELGPRADESAAAYLLSVLYLLTAQPRCARKQDFRYIAAEDYSPLSQRVVRYLEEHCTENVSLDDVAEAMQHSKTYLCVAFKRDTGTTILSCLNTIRIRRAAELITYGDYSLAQVSAMCGFATVSHFNRVFTKYAGVTPGQCRRAFPADILINYRSASPAAHRPNAFLYSVLARRRIPAEQSRPFDSDDVAADKE